MIIVSGLHRKSGQVRTQTYQPGREGPARAYREHLRALGYHTVFVNDVRKVFQELSARRAAERNEPFSYKGIPGYQLHSLGTASGGYEKHIKGSATDTLTAAIENAESKVDSWSEGHKGIVIYRAIKLVRRVAKPTTEIVELS